MDRERNKNYNNIITSMSAESCYSAWEHTGLKWLYVDRHKVANAANQKKYGSNHVRREIIQEQIISPTTDIDSYTKRICLDTSMSTHVAM